jgi:hypothetical protein
METKIDLNVRNRIVPMNEILKQFAEGEIGCIIDWEVRDTETNKLIEVGQKKAESFLVQFLDMLWANMNFASTGSGFTSRRNDNALVVQQACSNKSLIIAGTAGTVVDGIIVGTGNTAPTVTDYKIETLIAHGAGAGQLQYGAVTFGAPASDATTSQYTITRNFANASGGGITVNEIGLYVNNQIIASVYTIHSYFMWLRDVIAGGILVNNGQTLTVNYRPQAVI